AFQLIEELLARIDVIVLAGVRAADHHDDEVAVAKYALVTDRWAQQRPVGIDPLPQVECLQGLHVASGTSYVTRCADETRRPGDATGQAKWHGARVSGLDARPGPHRVLASALAVAQAAASRAAGGPLPRRWRQRRGCGTGAVLEAQHVGRRPHC